jgi:hypothetical protein
MENVTFVNFTDQISGEVITNAIIDRGNGEFTSMLKSTYDAMKANSTLPSNSSIPQAGE